MNAIKNVLDNRESKSYPTVNILKMLEFVLKNKCFEFNGKVKQQLSDMAICTKCAPPYACVFMDKVEAGFFKSQKQKPVVQFRYFDDIYLFGLVGRSYAWVEKGKYFILGFDCKFI